MHSPRSGFRQTITCCGKFGPVNCRLWKMLTSMPQFAAFFLQNEKTACGRKKENGMDLLLKNGYVVDSANGMERINSSSAGVMPLHTSAE